MGGLRHWILASEFGLLAPAICGGFLPCRPVLGSVVLRKTTCGASVVARIRPCKVVVQHKLVGQFRSADGLALLGGVKRDPAPSGSRGRFRKRNYKQTPQGARLDFMGGLGCALFSRY